MRSKVLGEHFRQSQGAHRTTNHATIDRTRYGKRGEAMKFAMAIEKHGKTSIGRAEGHNARHHATNSQLPQSAWITKQGHHTIVPWRGDVLDAAKGLAKRKDAVVAIEIVLQVGHQADWREMPTAEHPEGRPKPGAAAKLKALTAGAKQAAAREFGVENIVSIEVHTDESTPHVHIVAVPVKDGKLQAKAWLDGAAKCAQLRERIHADVNKHIACSYTKGAPGGEPHDQSKRAGGPGARKPAPEPEGWVEKVKGLIDKSDEVRRLKAGMEEVRLQLDKTQQDLAKVFSQLKASIKRAERAENRAITAEKEAEKQRKEREKAEGLVGRLRSELDRLRPKPPQGVFGEVLEAATRPSGNEKDGVNDKAPATQPRALRKGP